jgi:hypothetical protein
MGITAGAGQGKIKSGNLHLLKRGAFKSRVNRRRDEALTGVDSEYRVRGCCGGIKKRTRASIK